MQEILEMTQKELERVKILTQVKERKISQVLAAKILKVSDRQIRNLLARLNLEGDKGVISKKRGKLKNHCLPKDIRENALAIVRNHYEDFGPKLANEYLKSQHDIRISNETLRQWMIQTHLWIPRTQQKNIHLPRKRKGNFGELIQIDGSHHDWFEGRLPPCVLMVFIDDATSLITSLYFSQTENLEAYLRTLQHHLEVYGIPLACYGDRCSVNIPRVVNFEKESTQFKRVLDELDCKLLLANSPQAKGRVERVNRTLQDRLVKEMRIKGISTIAEANKFLEGYIERHNQLFAKRPREQGNAHRAIAGLRLEQILSVRETRCLNKDFIIQYDNKFYQILGQEEKLHFFKGGKIEIRTMLNGKKIAMFENKKVQMISLGELKAKVLDMKQIMEWKEKNHYQPPKSHPYKDQSYRQMLKQKGLQQGDYGT